MSIPQVFGEYRKVDIDDPADVAMACRQMLARMLDRLYDARAGAPTDPPALVSLSLFLRVSPPGPCVETRMELSAHAPVG